jgi:hypothetical protein
MAHKRERLGRITDLAGKAAGCSGRTVRRLYELKRLFGQLFGDEKVIELLQDIKSGRTAPIYTMLRAAKALAEKQLAEN